MPGRAPTPTNTSCSSSGPCGWYAPADGSVSWSRRGSRAITALRPFATGRLVCVFGCGGDRDRGKRPVMGDIAARKADVVIVTDDNPRSEEPEAIRRQILDGAPLAREIGDRAAAIRAAVAMLEPGDVLVVAGKGHETGQIVGDRTLPFSDHEAVRAAIAERGA